MNITNKHNISLPLAVLLLRDDYDHDDRPNVISTTTLMKPLKSIIIGRQNVGLGRTVDLMDLVPSSMGNAFHDWLENAWKNKDTVIKALRACGASDEEISRIRINPVNPVEDGDIVVFIEKRSEKEILGFIISGKFDSNINGRFRDLKSCSAWSEVFSSNDIEYTKQGSIYKWLNQDIESDNVIDIDKIFTDWSKSRARQGGNYPKARVMSGTYPLWSVEKTEQWIIERLTIIDNLSDAEQSEMPVCTKEELWASDDAWKYYKKIGAKRATKVYYNQLEAEQRMTKDGGEIKFFPGEIRRCTYCNAVGKNEKCKSNSR